MSRTKKQGDLDMCECGYYRNQHAGGTGERIGGYYASEKCDRFRFYCSTPSVLYEGPKVAADGKVRGIGTEHVPPGDARKHYKRMAVRGRRRAEAAK